MFRRRPTSMNNERYVRVSRDEQQEQQEALGENAQEEENGVPVEGDAMKFAWAPKPATRRSSFLRLPTDDDDDADDDAMTSPTSNVPSASNTPTMMRSPATSIHGRAPSFDLDDDLDMDLQRYQLDFSDNSMDRKLRESTYLAESLERGQVSLSLLHTAYMQTQAETRRKRIEQLLSVTTERERLWITIRGWCDIYDRGLCVLLTTTVIWLSISSLLLHHTLATMLGILFFLSRITAKPLYWYVWGRHVARKRKVTMEIYEKLNQGGMEMNSQHHHDSQQLSTGSTNAPQRNTETSGSTHGSSHGGGSADMV